MILGNFVQSRDNNFNLIRFLAAALVILSHSFPLVLGKGNQDPLFDFLGITAGTFAVDIFFVSSGFLITHSFMSRHAYIYFIRSRILRIFPALIVANLLTFFSCYIISDYPNIFSYVSQNESLRFILKNSTLIFGVHFTLPDVFMTNPFPNVVNGSLWTLPHEIRLYGLLLLYFFVLSLHKKLFSSALSRKYLNKLSKHLLLKIIVISTFGLYAYCYTKGIYLPKYIKLCYLFFSGSLFYLYSPNILLKKSYILFLGGSMLITCFNQSAFHITYYLIIPYVTLYLAYIPKGLCRRFNSFGDYSYGLYIYAFPIQQIIIFSMPEITVFKMAIIAFFIALIVSILSWEFIEKKALRYKYK